MSSEETEQPLPASEIFTEGQLGLLAEALLDVLTYNAVRLGAVTHFEVKDRALALRLLRGAMRQATAAGSLILREEAIPSAADCPECGEPVEEHEGRRFCPDCGWEAKR